MDVQLLASYQESLALLGLWLGVFLGDIDSGNAVSCTILIVWNALLADRPSTFADITDTKDSDCVPQTWFEGIIHKFDVFGRISKQLD